MKRVVIALMFAAVIAPPAHAQTTALNRVMRQKLADAQAVLAAVVTSNWTELERRSHALEKAVDDPAWTVLRTPEYTKQSEAFLYAVRELVDAASRRDADGAPLAYVALTMRCVQCHRYVARARIASAGR